MVPGRALAIAQPRGCISLRNVQHFGCTLKGKLPMVPVQIERDIFIAAPVERVWVILTEPEHFRAWFAFDGAEIDLRPGGGMVMNWKEHGRFLAVVERVEPPHRFSFRGSRLPEDEPREGNATIVEFTLTPSGDGTLLRVVESGFRDL